MKNKKFFGLTLLFILSLLQIPSASAKPDRDVEAIGKFTVQLAAFDNEAAAKNYVQHLLKDEGVQGFYFAVEINDRVWFRVGTGLFATERRAKVYKAKLLSKTKLSEAIVRPID